MSLPSGEAEYYVIVKGSSMGLGIRSMLQDFGVNVNLVVRKDASAANGIADRNQLWVQDRVARSDLTI